MEKGPVFGLSIGELLTIYDHDSRSWKMSECLFTGDLIKYLKIFQKLTMIANGKILGRPMLALLINVKGYGLLHIQKEASMGVYLIINIINCKFYVGSTKQKFSRRIKTHIRELENNRHHCQPLQRAFNKYGINNFIIILIPVDANERINIEQNIINSFKEIVYNTCKIAGCPNVVLSEDAKRRISIAMSNRTISQKTKDKISETLTGRKRGIEFSKMCSNRLKGKPLNIPNDKMFRGKKVQRLDTMEIYESAVSASKFLGFADNSVSKAIYRNRKTGGTFWKYI